MHIMEVEVGEKNEGDCGMRQAIELCIRTQIHDLPNIGLHGDEL